MLSTGAFRNIRVSALFNATYLLVLFPLGNWLALLEPRQIERQARKNSETPASFGFRERNLQTESQ
jgi:hypothetical protein